MADEVYRAVFLRVHPTGKMVLSLTTEADGNEPGYAELVGEELGVPALDVKVVPADTDRFGIGHGFNTSPSGGHAAAISSAAAKIRDKGRLLAAMALDAPPDSLEWANGAWSAGEELQDGRGRRAVRARHRRAPARRRGRPRRADGLPRLVVALEVTLERDLDLVEDLQRPEQRGVGLHAPVGLLDGRASR